MPCPNTPSGALMGRVNLSSKVIAAFRNAGATEKMISRALGSLGARVSGSVGRPRKYKNRSECDRAYKLRRKERARISVTAELPSPGRAPLQTRSGVMIRESNTRNGCRTATLAGISDLIHKQILRPEGRRSTRTAVRRTIKVLLFLLGH
jgi:hypothetical protein